MSRPICRLVAVLALAAAVTAGCTPAPGAPPDPFPPRPADIDIERVDPCATLTAEQRDALQVGVGRPGTAPVGGATTRACGWGSLDTPFDYSVQLIPQDAAGAVGSPEAVVGATEGYGTVQITDRVETFPLCEVLVDINDGELMRVQVQTVERQRGDGAPYPIDRVCEQAELVATEAVRNMRDQAG